MERKTRSNKRGNKLLYILEDGTGEEVGLDIQQYQNGNLSIGLISDEDGYQEQFVSEFGTWRCRVKVVTDDDISFCNYLDSVTWTSSDPSVAQVDSLGVVTVKKSGDAVITASAENGMSASCKLINAPKSTSLTSVKGGNGSITIRWKKQKQADGYIIRISEGKSLDSYGIEGYVEGYKNTKQAVSNLGQKQTYYIRIRTYKEAGGKIIYSDWSKAKKVRTK